MFILFKLYLVFFQIGSFSFGGGYAMLPFIEKNIVDNHAYLTAAEFMDVLAISQITPGPIAINAATFVGYRSFGLPGATAATLGIISGPFILMSLIHPLVKKYKDSALLNQIFSYLRPITIALILSAAYSAVGKSLIDLKSLLIFVLSIFMLKCTKIHPIFILLAFGFLGIFLF